jgi:hypothetical protein
MTLPPFVLFGSNIHELYRVEMCQLACEQNSSWLMVDDWEARLPEYQRTAVVLDHFEHEINEIRGGVEDDEGEYKPLSKCSRLRICM